MALNVAAALNDLSFDRLRGVDPAKRKIAWKIDVAAELSCIDH